MINRPVRAVLPNYLIPCLFAFLATIYSLVIPPFEAPDEYAHFYNIQHMLLEHTLPHQLTGNRGEAHQPPLYYWIAALFSFPVNMHDPSGTFRANPQFLKGEQLSAALHGSSETFPFRGRVLALRLARGASVLMGTSTILLVMLLGRKIFPDRPLIGWLAAGLSAFTPQFLFSSGVMNNDNLLILLASAAWLQCIKAWERPDERRQWVWLGILTGLGLMVKLTGVVIGAVAGLVLLYTAIHRRSYKFLLWGVLYLSLPAILISGWWFVRNQLLYGDPLGWEIFKIIFASNRRTTPINLQEIELFLRTQYQSFWGVFGWMNVFPPGWFFLAVKWLMFAGVIGIILLFFRKRFNRFTSDQKKFLMLLAAAILLQELVIIFVALDCNASCYQGRYLFPVIGPLMILLSLGIVQLIPRGRAYLAALPVIVLLFLAIYMPFEVIKPAYPSVFLPKWRLWTLPHQVDVNFGNQIALRGYHLANLNGSQAHFTLYWQLLLPPEHGYIVSLQLLDSYGRALLEKEQILGESLVYPPENWWMGDIIADEYWLEMPSSYSPGNRQLLVGIRPASGQKPLLVVNSGRPERERLVIDWIPIPK